MHKQPAVLEIKQQQQPPRSVPGPTLLLPDFFLASNKSRWIETRIADVLRYERDFI